MVTPKAQQGSCESEEEIHLYAVQYLCMDYILMHHLAIHHSWIVNQV